MRNYSYENVFLLQVHFNVKQTRFHMKGFARGLVLKQKHKVTWKWSSAKRASDVMTQTNKQEW